MRAYKKLHARPIRRRLLAFKPAVTGGYMCVFSQRRGLLLNDVTFIETMLPDRRLFLESASGFRVNNMHFSSAIS